MLDRLRPSIAWRTTFLISIASTAVALFFTVLCILQHGEKLAKELSRWSSDAKQSSWSPATLIVLLVNLLLASGAMVCLLLAIYFGPLRSWNNALVISLFTAGFGGCLVIMPVFSFWVDRIARKTSATDTLAPSSTNPSMLLRAFFTVLWGASYHSFNHYFREFIRHSCHAVH
jgi:hypothetical protein